ncbi:DinB family protein [Aureivirga sp. CE67]|uniref:DinB family protein n=1 Tax=Aureivirga sp. CE67 TaxID=1788983 RepID=UPI0018CAE2AC|nr:DinB family protein [Aureivirga sp. CE67]
MKLKAEDLLKELETYTKQNIETAEKLKQLDLDTLQKRANPSTWNALECFEHLNMYGVFYNPEIKNRIENAKHSFVDEFKSGMIGNYFAKSMLPNEKQSKMKTYLDKDPKYKELDKNTISVFIKQQEEMLKILKSCRKVNLTKTKTAISISTVLKLRLGDTLRVVIYHNIRHIEQAKRAVGI